MEVSHTSRLVTCATAERRSETLVNSRLPNTIVFNRSGSQSETSLLVHLAFRRPIRSIAARIPSRRTL